MTVDFGENALKLGPQKVSIIRSFSTRMSLISESAPAPKFRNFQQFGFLYVLVPWKQVYKLVNLECN
jgi:hypothetical protein